MMHTPTCSDPGRRLKQSAVVATTLLAALLLFPVPGETRPRSSPEPAPQRPLLWRIDSPGNPPSYLFGTIHVPDPRVTELPEVVKRALDAADAVYTEIPMNLLAKTAAGLMMVAPASQRLDRLLSAEQLARADAALRTAGLNIDVFRLMKVWVLTVTVGMLDLLPQLGESPALDEQLYDRGSQQGQEVGGLETVSEQIGAFDALTLEEQLHLLEETLDQWEESQQAKEEQVQAKNKGKKAEVGPGEELVRLYLKGDEEALLKATLADFDPKDPLEQKAYRVLIADRNHRMAERMAEKIHQQPGRSFFFAVGAGHLGGKESVIALLRGEKMKLTRLKQADAASLPARTRPVPQTPEVPAAPVPARPEAVPSP